ncbi:MAG: DnaD domain protein [Chloroflexi bacterium]|nr:DnaD domain protein [Chloroflexota bacterium]
MSNLSFSGFPAGKVRFSRIPGPFFKELLPLINNLNELKVTLYALWKLDRMEGEQRYLQLEDFSEDTLFMEGLGENAKQSQQNLNDGLQRALKRGALLQGELELDGSRRTFYFLNSGKGRQMLEALKDGDWRPSGEARYPIELSQERSNLFTLYERHIGPVTPLLADALKEAEREYPLEWLEDAIRIAVENNARAWSYVEAILTRWRKEGRDERRAEGDSEKERRKYYDNKYSDSLEL